jgi:RNA polymerase primary sigma factor
VFVSSNARKTPPPGVLAHPAITALVAQASATPAGTITPDELRQAAEEAGVEPQHLKALMTHLAGLGISVALPADARVAAATTTKKATTAKAAKAAPAKKAAAKAPAKKAAAKTAEKPAAKTAAKKAADAAAPADAAATP